MQFGAGRFVAMAVPSIIGCAIMAASVLGLRGILPSGLHPAAVLAILAVSGAAVYAATLFVLWPDIVKDSLRMLRSPRAAVVPTPLP